MEKSQLTGGGLRNGWLFLSACLLALVVLLGAYSNSFQNAFHFDDSHVVVGNLFIRDLGNVPRFFVDAATFSSLPANAAYRPLVTATLAVDYWLGGGLEVRQFHVTQFTMLLLLGVMVFWLCLALFNQAEERWWNRWAALLAAALYSVHTPNTETLNLIHARSELLSTLGVVGSFLVYLYLPRSRRAHLYLLPMIAGALAKTPAVMFAPLFLGYLLLFEQRVSAPDLFSPRSWPLVRAAIWKSVPAFVVGAALFVFIEAMNAPTLTLGGGARLEYLQTQLFVWLHYGRLFFLPLGLSADTDWTLIPRWYDTRVIAGLLFVALLLRVLWTNSRTPSRRPVAFGLAWFVLALLPASSVIPLAEVTNDHRPFFAYIGFSMAVVWGLALFAQRQFDRRPRARPLIVSAAFVVALVAVGANALGTYERNKVFHSAESLWRDVVEKSPTNGRGLMNYGLAKMARGQYEEAKQLFDRAAILNPNYATLEINLGIVTDRLGQPAVAEAHFARALQLQPNDPNPHAYYARWLVQQGRAVDAIPHLQRAVALSPADLLARHLLLDAYAKAGRAAELKALAAETLALAPGDPETRRYLDGRGEVALPQAPGARGVETAESLLDTSLQRYRAGDFQGSIDAARNAIALKPGYPEAYNNIAAANASLRRWDEAIEAAREALRLRPDFPLARNNLRSAEAEKQKTLQDPAKPSRAPAPASTPSGADALVNQSLQHTQAGRFEECISTATQAAKLDPTSAQAFNNLGYCSGRLQRWDEAIRNTQEAIRLAPDFQVARNNLAWMQQEKLKVGAATAK
jgi:Flp pilus assembly protein TadD